VVLTWARVGAVSGRMRLVTWAKEAEVSDKDVPGIVTIALPDRLDSTTSIAAGLDVMAQLRPGGSVIIDGAAVTYMSAAGVRVLANAFRRATELGARVVLCRFTGAAADCLLVSGFSQLFDTAASVEEATARLRHGTKPRI
jgi:anti-sigma B factor antagonist